MSDDLQKLLEKLRVEVSRIREQGDIDITRFDWVEHADEIERIAYGIESALSSLQAQSGERGIEGRARELLEIGKSLLELDEEANSLGTDSWAWLRQVEDFLAASSQVETLLTMEQSENSIETISCFYLEALKLEIRKRAFEEAAEHRPFEYDGREWDWECECGAHGHWSGDDNWKTHVLAQATAPAVNEYPEKKP